MFIADPTPNVSYLSGSPAGVSGAILHRQQPQPCSPPPAAATPHPPRSSSILPGIFLAQHDSAAKPSKCHHHSHCCVSQCPSIEVSLLRPPLPPPRPPLVTSTLAIVTTFAPSFKVVGVKAIFPASGRRRCGHQRQTQLQVQALCYFPTFSDYCLPGLPFAHLPQVSKSAAIVWTARELKSSRHDLRHWKATTGGATYFDNSIAHATR